MRKWRPIQKGRRPISLAVYDAFLLLLVDFLIFVLYPSSITRLTAAETVIQILLCAVCIFGCRFPMGVYSQIWRYNGANAYIKLILADGLAGCLYFVLSRMLPIANITLMRKLSIVALNLLLCILMRLMYQYLYQSGSRNSRFVNFLRRLCGALTGLDLQPSSANQTEMIQRIRIAIVGVGKVGAMLAEELMANGQASYVPVCFIDIDREKIGRKVFGLPVLSETDATADVLMKYGVQEIVFALPKLSTERKRELYDFYKSTGCKIKVYDYPTMQSVKKSKRQLREFDIEELLFRKAREFKDEKTSSYYRNKVVLITGGGGSIGSELCRQIAKMQPRQLIILDVYENGAYDIQQELKMLYGSRLDLQVEIMSVCNRQQLEQTFAKYHPNVVIHAAAHKHVPLMEHNCVEAVRNNVFGTQNVIEACEKYGAERFMMVSTDKAVNPTNVMGATKRMCEMMVQSASTHGKVKYSCTRFGNVLGSAGSVIPLFKRQIANGGPVTITDKRIIRYFMTIPEASQLVLASGAMAKNGELFVLDMGKPVRILDLAENMIRLSGVQGVEIVETGLRPGEKLYEELLVKTEDLDKTENSLIFIERDTPLPKAEIEEKLDILRKACETEDDERARLALMKAVPTYHHPEEVNVLVENADEMRGRQEAITA